MTLPEQIHQSLRDSRYRRPDGKVVTECLARLQVSAPPPYVEFFSIYNGPFWNPDVGYELLDIVDDEPRSIEGMTILLRKGQDLPGRFLVLTDLSADALLMLDTLTDKIYDVDFEGGYELLLVQGLNPRWHSFEDFLKEYFAQE